MAKALQADQAVITNEGYRYIDNEQGEERIVPFSDVVDVPNENIHAEELPKEIEDDTQNI